MPKLVEGNEEAGILKKNLKEMFDFKNCSTFQYAKIKFLECFSKNYLLFLIIFIAFTIFI